MRSRFITSSDKASGFPRIALPEFAFVGRSNVGKSSLLNGIAGAKIARTSRTPGRTQLVNFFEVEANDTLSFALADLPGYGWAKAPERVRKSWQHLIGDYVEKRDPLRAIMLLIDARRGAEDEDVEIHRWLAEAIADRDAEVIVVATKCDKLSKAELKPALGAIAGAFDLTRDQVIATSSTKNVGLDALRTWIIRSVKQSRVRKKPVHRSSVASDGC